MAGSKVNNYAIGDVNLTSVMSTLDDTRIGYCAVSLTNYATTGVPAIAAGSKVEVDGALFKFDSEEAIGGSPSDGTVYIKLVPAGSSITAEFTNTAPSWSTEKQGWYSPTAGEESYRYLPFGMTKSGSSYNRKREIQNYASSQLAFSHQGLGLSGIVDGAVITKVQTTLVNDSPQTAWNSVAYPTGFTRDNCIVIEVAIWVEAEWQIGIMLIPSGVFSPSGSCSLTASEIMFYAPIAYLGYTIRAHLIRLG